MSREFFERLRQRAVEIHVEDHLRSRLERGEKLRVKLGLDPTAPDLHVGHLVVLDMLKEFQQDGHTVVLIIGDYTSLIGDPSGRSETRPVLTPEQVTANAETYFMQVELVLDRKAIEVRRNSEWLAPMTAADILRLMGKATLQQVLQREDFANRIKAGNAIGAHEILYPFNQAYDSVAVKADVEIGGTDQLFNLLFGREIQKHFGQEQQDVAVFPLLVGTDGINKMSKSLGNYIGLTELPSEIYGKVMSIPDELIPGYGWLLLGIGRQNLPTHPREAKALIARKLVERLHGASAATDAEEDFDRKFRKRGIPDVVEIQTYKEGPEVYAALLHVGFAKTGSEARRLLSQGGVRVNGNTVSNGNIRLKDGDVLQAGKRRFVRIHIVG